MGQERRKQNSTNLYLFLNLQLIFKTKPSEKSRGEITQQTCLQPRHNLNFDFVCILCVMKLFTLHHIYDQVSALINNQIDLFFICVCNDHLHLNAPSSPGRQEALWGRCDRPRGENVVVFFPEDGRSAWRLCFSLGVSLVSRVFLSRYHSGGRSDLFPHMLAAAAAQSPGSAATLLPASVAPHQFGSVSCLLLICGCCSNCYKSVFFPAPAPATCLSG